MFVVNHKNVHRFVKEQNARDNDVRFDGWSLVFFHPTPYGYDRPVKKSDNVRTSGAFRDGRWGIETRVEIDTTGAWSIPPKSVRFKRR